MNINKILSMVDHTLLSQTATEDQIKEICDDAVEYGVASVCIPPSYVRFAKEYLCGKVAVCTVIGFPNGYNKAAVKCAEAKAAIEDGADEIDMVINLTDVKNGYYERVCDEIKQIKEVCNDKILKVIIETCLLTEDEKIKMCEKVTESGADFIKTSTGFAGGGATFADIEFFAKHIGSDVKIKAAGGIKSFEDAERFIELGASRLGTSRLVSIMKNEKTRSEY
ncbi:MAG: deoxyribose-phosphate aldolase [Ruminococcaceae bacterium]|nr:deoxyribose-phosphate aldolase [Oscillospiraceae bacterium]